MRFFFWNVRGLGKESRKRQVKDFIEEHNMEVVGLQETIKADFTDRELRELLGNRDFSWKWSPVKGRSGGS
jgi:exonuclease III